MSMEPELENFLKERRIDSEVILEMKNEKLDIFALAAIDEDAIKQFIPKFGDRIAVKDFCKRCRINKKESLLEKLKRKMDEKKNKRLRRSNSSQAHEDDTDSEEPSTSKLATPQCTGPNTKSTRKISVGWIRNGIQMRSKFGGGTRRIDVPKSWKKADLLKETIKLFFPNNVDSIELRGCTLLDFKHHEFNDELTVSDIYNITKMSNLSFYLSTYKETKEPNKSRDVAPEKIQETVNVHQQETTAGLFNSDISNTLESNDIAVYSSDEFLNFPADHFIETSINSEETSKSSEVESIKITLHRGHVLSELLEAFRDVKNVNVDIQIDMVLPNGTKEAAFDGGGVYRDALCEFWLEFYEVCCTGNLEKVPNVRHDYDEEKWKSAAKILWNGYMRTGYFPSKLSRPFMEQVMLGEIETDVFNSFLLYLGPYDSNVLKKALEYPAEMDSNEIMDILQNYECKTIISAANIHKTTRDIAHTHLIQKPNFIIDAWTSILRSKFRKHDLINYYEKNKVNNKNVVDLIRVPEDLPYNKQNIVTYLKRYLREADNCQLEKFLRFVTGADIITTDSIAIEFTSTSGIERMPVAHTCTCVLELSINYDNYNEFRYEFNNLLSSNIWVMDLT